MFHWFILFSLFLHFVTGSIRFVANCVLFNRKNRCKNLKFSSSTMSVDVCVCACLIDKVYVCGAWLLLTTNWILLDLCFFCITYFSCCCCFELIHYTLRLHLCFVVTYKEFYEILLFFFPPPTPRFILLLLLLNFFSPVLYVHFFRRRSIHTYIFFLRMRICLFLIVSFVFLFLFWCLHSFFVSSKHDIFARGYVRIKTKNWYFTFITIWVMAFCIKTALIIIIIMVRVCFVCLFNDDEEQLRHE